jgi:hypothetical protein
MYAFSSDWCGVVRLYESVCMSERESSIIDFAFVCMNQFAV